MIGKIGRSMASHTWMFSESRAIVWVSEGVMKTRDKLPLAGTTCMNDPPKALNKAANSGLHMDVVNRTVATNNKDIPTGLRVDNTAPSDTRNASKVMGSTRDAVTIIATLGNVRDTGFLPDREREESDGGRGTRGGYEHGRDRF
jgi:hypothetical protein